MPTTAAEIQTKVRHLIDTLAATLPRDQYRELVEEIQCDMRCRLDCLDEEDEARKEVVLND